MRFTQLVDLVLENKSKLFGALSSSLSYDEKNKIWEDIAKEISQTVFKHKLSLDLV